MRLTIELTDAQRAVVARLTTADEGDPSALVARAIAFDAARPVEPRWRHARPRAPRPRPPRLRARPGPDRFDAVLPPATGRALRLDRGDRLTIEQLADGQCVDLTVRELSTDSGRTLSTARTRAEHGIHPSVGDSLWSQPPEIPLLQIVGDTAPGHDLCFPPCTSFEYEPLTGRAGHRSCHALLAAATRGWFAQHAPDVLPGLRAETTEVLNLWLPSEIAPDGRLRSWPVACRRGDSVELLALTDVLVALSTCPDDLFGSSQYAPGPVRLRVGVGGGGGGGGGSGPVASSRPMRSPASASARHAVAVTVPDALVAHLDVVRAAGWLGTTRAAVARALLFRWYEATR